ncbi:Uncharacterized protein PBTT_06431 [Plasmodiophora brassicae]
MTSSTPSSVTQGESYQAAEAYFKQHGILPLFDKLCASLLYAKPDNPRAFLTAQLKKLEQRGGALKDIEFYTDEDLAGMFSVLDPLQRGQITADDARKGLVMLGIPQDIAVDEKMEQSLNRVMFIAMARGLLDKTGI